MNLIREHGTDEHKLVKFFTYRSVTSIGSRICIIRRDPVGELGCLYEEFKDEVEIIKTGAKARFVEKKRWT